jgi:pre-rRNA-processing protein TSR3
MHVLILRDPRESAAKCSLTPLRGMLGVTFVNYAPERRVEAGGRVLLDPDGEEIGPSDRGRDLLLIDCSWRRVPRLAATIDGVVLRRRLPPLVTAYPRRSRTFQDPVRGLASVEALFAATVLLGEPRAELLEGYRWRDGFLAANPGLLAGPGKELPPTLAPPGRLP